MNHGSGGINSAASPPFVIMRLFVLMGIILYGQAYGQVTVGLPHLAIGDMDSTVVVPVNLANDWDEIGGLQIDLSSGGGGLVLDTVLTTQRTLGWTIQIIPMTRDITRILLFDQSGENIHTGHGSIIDLIFKYPPGPTRRTFFPLTITAINVSDPIGGVIATELENGSITIGEFVEISIGSDMVDHGDTSAIEIGVHNISPLDAMQLAIPFDSLIFSPIEVRPLGRTKRVNLVWAKSANGVEIRLERNAGAALDAGDGPILEIVYAVHPTVHKLETRLAPTSVMTKIVGGPMRQAAAISPGKITISPGYFDPPRDALALAQRDGAIAVHWAPPTGVAQPRARLLLVDDDASMKGRPYADVGGKWASDLTAAGFEFDYQRIAAGADGPDAAMLQRYSAVIWVTGYEWGHHPTLTLDDQLNIAIYLDGGGNVWLLGQDILFDVDADFIQRYFGARLLREDSGTPDILIGEVGGPWSGRRFRTSLLFGVNDYGDVIKPVGTDAKLVLADIAVGRGNTAFWSVSLQSVDDRVQRQDIITRQLEVFGIALNGQGLKNIISLNPNSLNLPQFASPLKSDTNTRSSLERFTSIDVTGMLGEPAPVLSYSIYRQSGKMPDITEDDPLATLSPEQHSYVDTSAVLDEMYFYRVTANYQNDVQSATVDSMVTTPIKTVALGIDDAQAVSGAEISIPVTLTNASAVAGVRFELVGLPWKSLSNIRAVVDERTPPDWIISMVHDSATGVLAIVALSPRLTQIPPGEGPILQLLADTQADFPTEFPLIVRNARVSASNAEPYYVTAGRGLLSLDVERVQLRVGTGAPIQPGGTGVVTIFMNNPEPVTAFQFDLRSAAQTLELIDVYPADRLPKDANIAHYNLSDGVVRIIVSSFSNEPTPAGRGAVVNLMFRVADNAREGFVSLDLHEVMLSDQAGVTLRQTSVSGAVQVGEIRAVLTPGETWVDPGRTITVPISLTSGVPICRFSMNVKYDEGTLDYISTNGAGRLSEMNGVNVMQAASGLLQIEFESGGSWQIEPAIGDILMVNFAVNVTGAQDTALSIDIESPEVYDCAGKVVFASAGSGFINVGKLVITSTHYQADVTATGITHYIQLQRVTLGGAYLDEGDEVAVMDTSNGHKIVVGTGVVRRDGSIGISAIIGFGGDQNLAPLPGATPGAPIVYTAWDKQTDTEGRWSTDADYILGQGRWGENNGLTLAGGLRVPEQFQLEEIAVPDRFVVEKYDPDPFNGSTTIRFGIPEELNVVVSIHSLLGRKIAVIHDGLTSAGYHDVVWDGKDSSGKPVKSGMLFYQVRTPGKTITKKMLIMR